MDIHITHDGQSFGPYSSEETHRRLGAGEFQLTDLAWTEDQPEWMPLSSLPGFSPAEVAPQPVAQPVLSNRPIAAAAVPVRPQAQSGIAVRAPGTPASMATRSAQPLNAPYPASAQPQANTMTKRLKRVAPLQLGIVLGTLYAAISLIFLPFIILISIIGAKSQNGGGFLAGGILFIIFIPVIYGFLGFIGGVISGAVYNLIAKWTGGIEFTLADVPQR